MSGIRELLEGLEDPYPLRRRRREARERAADRLTAVRRGAAVRSLARIRGEEASPANPAADPAVEAEGEALRSVERACADLERRWEALDRAVGDTEISRGLEPMEPGPEVLAEIHLLTTGASVLHDGFAPRTAAPPPEPRNIAGRAALAVGAGIALAALGAPHFAFHAAMAATHADGKSPKKIKRPPPGKSAGRALERLRSGLPAGEPSADGVREALDALARAPRSGECWDGFLEAAQERLGVLRRAHLRARAAALLAEER